MNAPTPAEDGAWLDDRDYRAVCQFLFREAELLAAQDYRAWLAMLTPDIRYRVPLQQFTKRGEERGYGDDPAWLDETYASLAIRVGQLLHPASNAQRVPNFLRYFVTNIQGTATADALHVGSQVLLIRVRANNPQPFLLSGARRDVLTRTPAGLRLAAREVRLDMPRLDTPNLALFL
jgi:3-phenylpropionate/cinnamic acid dioxygenase small subunit